MNISRKHIRTTLVLLVTTAVMGFGAVAMAHEKAPRVETAFERDTSHNAQAVNWDGLHAIRSAVVDYGHATGDTRVAAGGGGDGNGGLQLRNIHDGR